MLRSKAQIHRWVSIDLVVESRYQETAGARVCTKSDTNTVERQPRGQNYDMNYRCSMKQIVRK